MRKNKHPPYVPLKVRILADEMLYGAADNGKDGWLSLLEKQRAKLVSVTRLLLESLEAETLLELRLERLQIEKHIHLLQKDVDCLNRLIGSGGSDMKEAYVLLGKHLDVNQAWPFIYSAFSAKVDFSGYRDSVKNASDLASNISVTARHLADQLSQIIRIGVHLPGAFYSVQDLLGMTDAPGRDRNQWRILRPDLLGNHDYQMAAAHTHTKTPSETDTDDGDAEFVEIESELDVVEVDKPHAVIGHDQKIRDAWRYSPSPEELLRTLANIADNFKPEEDGLIGAALKSRQESIKAAYVRGFAHLLIQNEIAILPELHTAIATTATVVINQADLVVSRDDVRNALKKRPKSRTTRP